MSEAIPDDLSGADASFLNQLAAILDTLARAHWELGDKQAAIAVQDEAVRVGASDGSTDESRRELADTLERYRSTEPPRPPGG